ncbi:tetratricopeptide repeat protein [Phaeobacter sp. J2-8]|uniref:tetratricopeptide repeat protein n=1 Tax=Phaeobacter sp. J2-8 TaxID=2931394 RepID=UPI001FD4DF06|nr:tetratricopeptide repeat protein [Phaeobacter sp. J2-8]MCJ7874630.1 tetratricopeptide repeat protein [Phaeobacter sp. J2-8]
MDTIRQHIKRSVAALSLIVMYSLPSVIEAAETDALLNQLREAEPVEAARIEAEIARLWSRSGSGAMDLLLKRGQDAMDVQDFPAAIEHLTALIDHAPDFAEGYHMRAMAYYNADLVGPSLGDLEMALRLNPDHFAALRGLAVIFESLGDKKRALDGYEMVLRLHPNDEEAQKGVERLLVAARGRDL